MSTHKNLLIKIGIGLISITFVSYLFIVAINHNFLNLFGDSPTKEQLGNPISMEASEIYSDDGVLIGKYFVENRSSVKLDEISQAFIQTLIETEDKRFTNITVWISEGS
jgi:penicillin-binding protein 1A